MLKELFQSQGPGKEFYQESQYIPTILSTAMVLFLCCPIYLPYLLAITPSKLLHLRVFSNFTSNIRRIQAN